MLRRTHVFAIVLVIAYGTLFPGCVANIASHRASGTQEQSTAHVEGTELVVESRNGSVQVLADTDRDDVHVVANITAGGSSPEHAADRLADTVLSVTRDTGRTLSVIVTFPEPRQNRDGAELTIYIPSAGSVNVTTTNGAVTAKGLEAPITAKTTNGRVRVADFRGEAHVTTSNGSVTLERHEGAATIQTSNGSVDLSTHAGSAKVTTSNGSITVSLTSDQPGPLQLRTTNGRITASVGTAFSGEVQLRTMNATMAINDHAGIIRKQETGRREGKIILVQDGPESSLETTNGSISLTTTPN